jgi:microcystin-dependent protein
MSCTNCYTGCVEITPDKCVRYTGENSVPLGIETGDTLLAVEQTLIQNVVSFLDGTGIDITIAPGDYCALVTSYLPVGVTPNSVQLFTALVKAACNLQTQITGIDATLTTLNADYTIGCLTGVTASSDTHAIVQAVINKACSTATDLTALALDVSTNYVKLSQLNTLIAAYLASITPGAVQFKDRMVPYSVVEYYGPLTNFDNTGKGLTNQGFTDIYLCNGNNGTPDKRGRVGVGAIVGVPGGSLPAATNPATPGNPNYNILTVEGANVVTLTTAQIPSHTHTASAVSQVTDPGHSHPITVNNDPAQTLNLTGVDSGGGSDNGLQLPTDRGAAIALTKPTGITVATTVTNTNTGDGASHSNIQPVLACYYIQYRPS